MISLLGRAPEHLRLGTWDLLCGWTRQSGQRAEPRLASGHFRGIRRTPGRRLAVEPMEGRVLMTADLGVLSGSVTFQDFVGQADTADYYRFRLDTPSSFSLRMDGMSADANVRLLDSNGGVIASSTNGGANPEAIDRVPGTVHCQVVGRWPGLSGMAEPNSSLIVEQMGWCAPGAR